MSFFLLTALGRDESAIYHFLGNVTTTMNGRSFFRASDGLIGHAPQCALPGDIIAVLVGVASPMLLRPTANKRAYQVVGACLWN
jgi:hypothetical protein